MRDHLRVMLIGLVLALPACGGGGGSEPAPITAYAAVVAVDQASVRTTQEFFIASIVGRSLPALVRFSDAAPQPLPVVIWSPGGGYSAANHRGATGWSRALARAGYAVIHLSHIAPTQTQLEAICMAEGVPPAECDDATISGADPDDVTGNPFTSAGVCRPSDMVAALDALPTIASRLQSDFGVTLDVDNVALCGWSSGSQAPMQLAGGVRTLSATLNRYAITDPRPKAFITVSPQGPGGGGFFATPGETSWDAVRGPLLVLTGDGDYKSKNQLDGPERRLAFENMNPGDKFLWYSTIDNGPEVDHGTFDVDGDPAADAEVAAVEAGLVMTALAFLDAYLRSHAPAAAWLQSDLPALAGGGGAEWERR